MIRTDLVRIILIHKVNVHGLGVFTPPFFVITPYYRIWGMSILCINLAIPGESSVSDSSWVLFHVFDLFLLHK